MQRVDWDIRREGRAWTGEEAQNRWELTPGKFEMWEGRLFFEEHEISVTILEGVVTGDFSAARPAAGVGVA